MSEHFVFMILPGNGCDDILGSNWYADLKERIEELFKREEGRKCTLIVKDMPDPFVAREKIWIPFVEKQLEPFKDDSNVKIVLIGHSSGAECAMRFIENHSYIYSCILVSACVTDMGIPNERKSGYYNREWNWKLMKENCKHVIQFASTDDPFIDYESEQKVVHDNLLTKLYLFEDKGHFLTFTADDFLLKAVQEIVNL
ncbi:hypothetical protein ABK040_005803 [Willaertia magna]